MWQKGPVVSEKSKARKSQFEYSENKADDTFYEKQNFAAASSQAQLAHELLERVDDLEDMVLAGQRSDDKLQTQVNKLLSDQEVHCHSVTEVYQNITALLQTTNSLTDAHKTLDDKFTAILASEFSRQKTLIMGEHASYCGAFEEQVRRLLENFKQEIVIVNKETAHRVEQLHFATEGFLERLVRMEETHKVMRNDLTELNLFVRTVLDPKLQAVDKEVATGLQRAEYSLAEVRSQHQRLSDDLSSRGLQGTRELSDLERHLQAKQHEAVESCRQEIHRDVVRLTDHVGSVQQDVVKSSKDIENLSQAVFGRMDDALRDISSKTQARLDALENTLRETRTEASQLLIKSVDDVSKSVEGKMEATTRLVSESSMAVDSSLRTFLQEQLRKLENDLDKRHKKLVESTHQALSDVSRGSENMPQIIANLQQQMQSVTDTLHVHGVAIDAQRLEGNLEGAFNELKEWLQDVERRMIGRSEVEDLLANVNSQLQSFRHQTLSSEMVFGQRLDAERAARENDISHQSVQLTKLQSVLKR